MMQLELDLEDEAVDLKIGSSEGCDLGDEYPLRNSILQLVGSFRSL
jgi:hypothetical protein